MRVYVSKAFKQYASQAVQESLVSAFKWWKYSESREYESIFFGKDAALVKPKIDGRDYVLRHCHLIPLNDGNQLKVWYRNHRWKARKTSDRVLIYVQAGENFYLIDIVDDPGGHEIMRMTTKDGKSFMGQCAQEAHAFLNGTLELQPI